MLTPLQTNVIIGSCLGDAHVERNGSLRFQHSLKQVEYLKWKHSQPLPHALSIKQYVQHDKRRQQTYHKVQFNTRTLQCFNKYREMFYVQGKKVVCINIIRLMCDFLALAVWYLDDGALRTDSRAFRFHNVMGTARIACVKCGQGLLEQPPRADVQEKQYILRIGASDGQAQRFCNLIKPLVADQVPSALYKFF